MKDKARRPTNPSGEYSVDYPQHGGPAFPEHRFKRGNESRGSWRVIYTEGEVASEGALRHIAPAYDDDTKEEERRGRGGADEK